MSPQPLTKFPGAVIDHRFDAVDKVRPEFRENAMKIIAHGSEIDCVRTRMVTASLDGPVITVALMFEKVRSAEAREHALFVVLERLQSKEDIALIREAWKWISVMEDHRHVYAHGIWAFSPQLPNDLVLINPAAKFLYDATWNEKSSGVDGETLSGKQQLEELEKLVNGMIQECAEVYSISDVAKHAHDAAIAHELAFWSNSLCRFPQTADELRQWLRDGLESRQVRERPTLLKRRPASLPR